MEFIIVKEGIIIEHLCGENVPEEAIKVPSGFPGFIGEKFSALKDDLSGIKPMSQQVSEGIRSIPDGYKINKYDNEIIPMSQDEIDAAFPSEVWAIPGTFESILVRKTFDRFGNFGYFPPEGAVKMEKPQPTTYHKAKTDGTWTPDIDHAKAAKLAEINSTYDAATSSLVATYPQTELLTFDQQESEARAYDADPTSETRLVDMLSKGRQIDKAELVRRIILKSDAFKLSAGYLTGQRQRYEDLLSEAKTVEEVEAIVPEYVMPHGLRL